MATRSLPVVPASRLAARRINRASERQGSRLDPFDHLGDLIGRPRPAEVVPLNLGAAADRRRANCSAVSTPSAVQRIPSATASPATARTIASACDTPAAGWDGGVQPAGGNARCGAGGGGGPPPGCGAGQQQRDHGAQQQGGAGGEGGKVVGRGDRRLCLLALSRATAATYAAGNRGSSGMMRRRPLLAGATIGLASPSLRAQPGTTLGTTPGTAPNWQPTRPIQCIIGFAPGGGADLIARAIIEAAQPLIPQPLVVVNRPGAGGTLAAQQVALLVGDGHTLLMGGGSESTSIPAFRQVPYDPKRSFRAVLRLMRQQMFILVRTDSRFQSMAQVMAEARTRPGAISHGSSGVGSIYHAAFLVLEKRAGVELLHVPYTGGAPGLQAVAAGHVDLMVASPEEFRGLTEGGLLRVLACCSADRAAAFPEVPTLRELGWDMAIENMKGWIAPAGTPPEAVAYLHGRFRQAMAAASWRVFVERAGETDGYLDGPAFQRAMDAVLDAIAGAVTPG